MICDRCGGVGLVTVLVAVEIPLLDGGLLSVIAAGMPVGVSELGKACSRVSTLHARDQGHPASRSVNQFRDRWCGTRHDWRLHSTASKRLSAKVNEWVT